MIRKVKKFDGGGVARFGTSLSGRMPRSGNYAELPSSGSTLGTTAFESFRNSPQGKKWAAEVEGVKSEREPREQVMDKVITVKQLNKSCGECTACCSGLTIVTGKQIGRASCRERV